MIIIHKSQILLAYSVHFYVCLLIYENSTVLNCFTLTKSGGICPLFPLAATGLTFYISVLSYFQYVEEIKFC